MKTYRSFERARRRVRELHRVTASDDREASEAWLLAAAAAIEKALTGTNLVSDLSRDLPSMVADNQTAMPRYFDFIASAVSSISSVLNRLPGDTESALVLDIIARGRRLSCLSTDPYERAECLRTLANTTLDLCTRMSQTKHYETGATVAQQSIELVKNAINSVRDPSKLETKEWQSSLSLRSVMYTRWFNCAIGLGALEVGPSCFAKRI